MRMRYWTLPQPTRFFSETILKWLKIEDLKILQIWQLHNLFAMFVKYLPTAVSTIR